MTWLKSWATRLAAAFWRWPERRRRQALAETAEQTLAKQAKLEVAKEAVLVDHLHRVAAEDVADVRRLKAERLGGPWRQAAATADAAASRSGGDDVIVCDNYTAGNVEHRPATPLLPWLLAAALAGAAGTWAWQRQSASGPGPAAGSQQQVQPGATPAPPPAVQIDGRLEYRPPDK